MKVGIGEVYECVEESRYEGEWTAEAIIEWAQIYSQKTIGRADKETIKNYFKGEGVMVQLFVNATYVGPEWIPFQDYLFERVVAKEPCDLQVAMPIINNNVMKRNTFSIVASDGVKYEHWIRNAGLTDVTLPAYFLIDFVGVIAMVDCRIRV